MHDPAAKEHQPIIDWRGISGIIAGFLITQSIAISGYQNKSIAKASVLLGLVFGLMSQGGLIATVRAHVKAKRQHLLDLIGSTILILATVSALGVTYWIQAEQPSPNVWPPLSASQRDAIKAAASGLPDDSVQIIYEGGNCCDEIAYDLAGIFQDKSIAPPHQIANAGWDRGITIFVPNHDNPPKEIKSAREAISRALGYPVDLEELNPAAYSPGPVPSVTLYIGLRQMPSFVFRGTTKIDPKETSRTIMIAAPEHYQATAWVNWSNSAPKVKVFPDHFVVTFSAGPTPTQSANGLNEMSWVAYKFP